MGAARLLLGGQTVALRERGVEVLALLRRDGDPRARAPDLGLVQTRAAQEERGVPFGLGPFARGRGDATLRPQILARGVDPAVQPRPRGQDRLVRELDRRLAGPRVSVERELAGGPERVEDRGHRLLIDVERGDLRTRHTTPGVLGPLPERDESQEELPRGFLPVVIELRVELLGPPPEGTRDATDLPVGLEEQRASVAPLEELGERVLHQRERAGLLRDVGQHRGDEARLERDVDPLGRARRSPARAPRATAAPRPRRGT